MKKNTKFIAILAFILSLSLFIFTGCDELFDALSIDDVLSVHMIDVGQGESILIVTPNKKTILIDAGEPSQGKKVKSYLKENHIDKIDLIIGTHPHADHIGGLSEVINNFEIGEIIMPKKLHTSRTFEKLLDTIESNNLLITPPPVGSTIDFDTDVKLHFLGPVKDYGDNLNLWSIVLKVEYKDKSFLFTGDTEDVAEYDLINTYDEDYLKANVLNVAHHGSSTSTTEQFLSHVDPEIALISLAKDNSYGHPHKEVIELLEQYGVLIYRTDLQQTVVLLSDGEEIWSHKAPVNEKNVSE